MGDRHQASDWFSDVLLLFGSKIIPVQLDRSLCCNLQLLLPMLVLRTV
jgi:hypothetical protein